LKCGEQQHGECIHVCKGCLLHQNLDIGPSHLGWKVYRWAVHIVDERVYQGLHRKQSAHCHMSNHANMEIFQNRCSIPLVLQSLHGMQSFDQQEYIGQTTKREKQNGPVTCISGKLSVSKSVISPERFTSQEIDASMLPLKI
jgi:hypothetical protein